MHVHVVQSRDDGGALQIHDLGLGTFMFVDLGRGADLDDDSVFHRERLSPTRWSVDLRIGKDQLRIRCARRPCR
jgi:hypothetical protein